MTYDVDWFSLLEASAALDTSRQKSLHWAREDYRRDPNGLSWRLWVRRAKRLKTAGHFLTVYARLLKDNAAKIRVIGKEADHV